MITLDNVHKRYWTNRGEIVWALRGVTLTIPHGRHVALIGPNGAGKSTLLRLIAGIDEPTRGTVRRDRRISWPLGIPTGLQGNLSGRQNARFISRLQGFTEEEIDEKIEFVRAFSELANAFEKPIATYSRGMRGRLNFALSVAFEYDVYLVDEKMNAGGGTNLFKQKTDNTMQFLSKNADLIIASHSERILKSYCDSAIWLRNGTAHWFDSVDEAWSRHMGALRKANEKITARKEERLRKRKEQIAQRNKLEGLRGGETTA